MIETAANPEELYANIHGPPYEPHQTGGSSATIVSFSDRQEQKKRTEAIDDIIFTHSKTLEQKEQTTHLLSQLNAIRLEGQPISVKAMQQIISDANGCWGGARSVYIGREEIWYDAENSNGVEVWTGDWDESTAFREEREYHPALQQAILHYKIP